jgi:hypothetical protein
MGALIEGLAKNTSLQLEMLLSSGYHLELGKTADEYVAEVQKAAEKIDLTDHYETIPTLVEGRIPFFRQLALLGIQLDPAVYYKPKSNRQELYAAKVKVIDRDDPITTGFNLRERVHGLPSHLLPSTPFEGLISYLDILNQKFVAFPGGNYEHNLGMIAQTDDRPLYLCLNRFLGNPQVTHISNKSTDYFTGILATVREPSN